VGYCHYWYRKREIEEALFRRIVLDFERIILPLEEAGVPLAGISGEGLPEIDRTQIAFNGVTHCGHVKNGGIYIPFPSADASGVGDSLHAVAHANPLFVQLKRRTCDGTCRYDTFSLKRNMKGRKHLLREDGRYFSFCKTAFRPYDLAVQCVLLICKHHMGDQIQVESDGSDPLWNDPRVFCYAHLGYPLNEFYMDQKRGLISAQERRGRES
jgi:hypothetical protein